MSYFQSSPPGGLSAADGPAGLRSAARIAPGIQANHEQRMTATPLGPTVSTGPGERKPLEFFRYYTPGPNGCQSRAKASAVPEGESLRGNGIAPSRQKPFER